MRGRIHRYRAVPLIVTYHPAYLLRNLPDKAKAWEDLCLARATMRTSASRRRLANSSAGPQLRTVGNSPVSVNSRESTMRKLFGSTMGAIAAIVVVLSLSGCGYNDLQRQDEQIKSAWSEVLEPVSAPRRSRPQPRQHREGLRRAGAAGADRSDQRARERRQHQGHARAHQRSGGLRQVPGGARSIAVGAVAVAGRRRKLSEPQVRPELPRSAVAAGRNREPDRRRSQSLHQVGAGVQHYRAFLPVQPDGDAVQDGRETQFRGGQRKGDQCAADGRLLEAARAPAVPAPTPAPAKN